MRNYSILTLVSMTQTFCKGRKVVSLDICIQILRNGFPLQISLKNPLKDDLEVDDYPGMSFN